MIGGRRAHGDRLQVAGGDGGSRRCARGCETVLGVGAPGAAASTAGALDTWTKELMAQTTWIATRCDGRAAYRAHAAIYTSGGPAAVYGADDQMAGAADG